MQDKGYRATAQLWLVAASLRSFLGDEEPLGPELKLRNWFLQ